MAKRGSTRHDKEAYSRFRFILGVTIAHELVHCFMGFLSGTEKADTPVEIMGLIATFSGSNWGDSGTVWECFVLGGKVTSFEEPRHPLGDRQAGRIWLEESNDCVREIAITATQTIEDRRGASAPLV